MLTIYRSNKLNILLLKMCEIIKKKPLYNIFEREILIHDNQVLFQYMNIFIANQTNISGNFKFYRPIDFIWKLFEIIMPFNKIKNIFTKSMMTFKIMTIIDENIIDESINKKDQIMKKFKFSFLMANIFEQYLIYRPDWINMWEKERKIEIINSNQEWQMKLWIKLINHNKKNNQSHFHFSNIFSFFQLSKNTQKIKKKYLPSRFFVLSSFSLNPYFIKIFKTIGKYIDIYFLHITPCKKNIFYLNSIKNDKKLLNEKQNKKCAINASLIELWGKYEQIYEFHIINSKQLKQINLFKKNQTFSILNNIQNDILTFNQVEKKEKKRYLSSQDDSISINICYNKHHEIEILYEKLLVFLNENENIQPKDIVITSFKINDYIPYINSIFKPAINKKQIPFFISSTHSNTTKIILSSFSKILNLSNSRFNNEEILELLDIPEIANHFNISEDEIDILYNWVETSNIRWSFDKKHKKDLGLPENNQNTWFYGIEKLMLSYAMNDTCDTWNNILSYTSINGSRAELIGKLSEFINTLNKWRKKLLRTQLLTYWYSLSKSLINDFFCKSSRIKTPLKIIHTQWIKMVNDHIVSGYKKKFLLTC